MCERSTGPSDAGGHLFWLDWLRFIAAFMVVAIHARGGNWVEWGRLSEASQTKLAAVFFALTRAGTEWVVVFFVLSGFLVGGKVIQRVGAGGFRLRDYAIDRLSRIWVPLAPALVWSGLVAIWVGKSVSWVDLGGNLLGLQVILVRCFGENIPLWSLAYEVWFYLVAGAAGVWVRGRFRARILASVVLVAGFAVFTRLQPVFLFAWLIGALTYWLCDRPRNAWLATLGAILMLLGYASSQLRSATVSVDTSGWSRFVPSEALATLVLALGIALLLPFLAQLRPQREHWLALYRWGGHLAAFSYTLYLTHYPALYLWENFLPERHSGINSASLGWYVLRVVSCLLFAWLCYLPFERNTGQVRRFMKHIWSPPTIRG